MHGVRSDGLPLYPRFETFYDEAVPYGFPPASSTMIGSLRLKLVFAFAGLVLLVTLLQGWFSYSSARRIIERDAIEAVGLSAEARRQALLYELRHRQQRVDLLLERLRSPCLDSAPSSCREILASLVEPDPEIQSASLRSTGSGLVTAGASGGDRPPRPVTGLLAAFRRDAGNRPFYVVSSTNGEGDTLSIRFRIDEINELFLDRRGLGTSGEAFLTNEDAIFLTPPRYGPGVGQESHPIEARPMDLCLDGVDGEILDRDYRGAKIVHGFRQVPEIGGGCIMVHLDQEEAFAPAETLGRRLFAGVGLFGLLGVGVAVLLGRTLTKPVLALGRTASRVARGELDARAPVLTSDEVGDLARTFNEMLQRIAERTEELAAANRELEAFSYSVSHDLRAPVRAIDGFSKALVEDYGEDRDPELVRRLGTIRTQAQRMGGLIEDLLFLSGLGRREMRRVTVDMKAEAERAFAGERSHLEDRSVRFEIGPLSSVEGDPAMLRQVFSNLLSNAIKFTRDQDPALIRVGHERTPERHVYVVSDNGVGFDMKYSEKLFEPFRRLHPDDAFEGTGVGLAIVRRIVERHGGRIWAESEVNEGTTIYFSLPA